MGQRIKIRRDTTLNWALGSPVLADGELGYDKDIQGLKIGDGVTSAASLAWLVVANKTLEASKVYAITSRLVLPYNYGNHPSRAEWYLLCVAAQGGYAVGDRVYDCVANAPVIYTSTSEASVNASSTLPTIVPKAGGLPVAIVAASWSLNLKVWK